MAKKSASEIKDSTPKVSPLMQQYNTIKAKYPDACLLFRVGDFYETFGHEPASFILKSNIHSSEHVIILNGSKYFIVNINDYYSVSQYVYFIEINTVPGQTETSLISQQVRAMGMDVSHFYTLLIEEMFAAASKK